MRPTPCAAGPLPRRLHLLNPAGATEGGSFLPPPAPQWVDLNYVAHHDKGWLLAARGTRDNPSPNLPAPYYFDGKASCSLQQGARGRGLPRLANHVQLGVHATACCSRALALLWSRSAAFSQPSPGAVPMPRPPRAAEDGRLRIQSEAVMARRARMVLDGAASARAAAEARAAASTDVPMAAVAAVAVAGTAVSALGAMEAIAAGAGQGAMGLISHAGDISRAAGTVGDAVEVAQFCDVAADGQVDMVDPEVLEGCGDCADCCECFCGILSCLNNS